MSHLRAAIRLITIPLALFACSGASMAQLETRASRPLYAGSEPYSFIVGDFNKDGKLDVAVILRSDLNNVAILLGKGDGTFSAPVYYTAGNGPTTLAAGDFRGNGTLDLAVGGMISNAVYVMLGNGDGTFQPAVPFHTRGNPYLAGVGDFNHDGKLDIWTVTVGRSKCDCIEILPGKGDGTFGEPIDTTEQNAEVEVLATGDFNGDGNLDLVASELSYGAQIAILLGNGDGTFRPGATYTTANYAYIAVGKFVTGNDNLDLALAEPEGGEIAIFLGNGDGTFQAGQIIPGVFPAVITLADLNGDGKPDLIVGSGFTANDITTYLGNGDGTFQPGVSYSLGNETALHASGDFNGDHKTDVVVANFDGNSVITLLNTGVVSFSPTTPLDFSKQATGTTSVPQTVTLTNTGAEALHIASMVVKGQFQMTSTCGASVAAGGYCEISVTFSPQSKGAKSGTVILEDSASSKPQVIELAGTGT